MRRQDFSYTLPSALIAQEPLAERSASRLLQLERASGRWRDALIGALPELLAPGDLLIFNDTKVVAARLVGTKPTGGRVEILLERALGDDIALAHLSSSKPIRAGLHIRTEGGSVEVLERQANLWRIRVPQAPLPFFSQWGAVPLPPYIHRAPDAQDRERYQSVFARTEGAVAAPTASLHFDAALLAALERRGIERSFITLHIGAGTFQPVRSEDVSAHVMHAERVSVGPEACAAIERTRARGARVIAVGTTVVRALEAAALQAAALQAPALQAAGSVGAPLTPWSGETQLFIQPGFHFRIVDALITNFHLPESTLLMLVCAFAGREHVLAAYEHAVRAQYRFFSYGDAMLIAPTPLANRAAAI